jgi:hypothetical protein
MNRSATDAALDGHRAALISSANTLGSRHDASGSCPRGCGSIARDEPLAGLSSEEAVSNVRELLESMDTPVQSASDGQPKLGNRNLLEYP